MGQGVSNCAASGSASAVIWYKMLKSPVHWSAWLELTAGAPGLRSKHEQCIGLSDELAEPGGIVKVVWCAVKVWSVYSVAKMDCVGVLEGTHNLALIPPGLELLQDHLSVSPRRHLDVGLILSPPLVSSKIEASANCVRSLRAQSSVEANDMDASFGILFHALFSMDG